MAAEYVGPVNTNPSLKIEFHRKEEERARIASSSVVAINLFRMNSIIIQKPRNL